MADNLPVVITAAGLQPQTPAAIQAQLLASVAAVRPGYTANLPGSLIEDISSTDVAAIVECDSARVETVNSLTPLGANNFLLAQLGQMLGIPLGVGSNTSVLLTFSGPAGFVITQGFIVSDGTYQYVVQSGGIIGTDGLSDQLFALASLSGSWAVPPGTVTQLVTPPPSSITLTVVNSEAGVPGTGTETAESYRSRVLQANLAASQGMARYLRTMLGNVSGVQPRLVAVQQRDDGKWMVIVGGGDPYRVAYAIWTALFDVNNLSGSQLFISDISSTNPGVVDTFLNHGFAQGDNIEIDAVDPGTFDGSYAVLAIINEKSFSLGTRFSSRNLTGQSWSANETTYTTGASHGITVGSTFTIVGSSPAGYNGTYVAVAGTTGTTLKAAQMVAPGSSTVLGSIVAGIALFDTTALTYTSDGIVTPNPRNLSVTINDWPDSYVIPFVNPPQQVVTMAITWNTSSLNFVAPAAVAQLGGPAVADYVNSIYAGQPINLDTAAEVFRAAIAPVLAPELLTRLVFAVSINGISTPPVAGTVIVEGDPESYFFAESSGIDVDQG